MTAKDASELVDEDKDAIKELRVEYDRKLAQLQSKFDNVSKRTMEAIEAGADDDDYTLTGLGSRFESARDGARDMMQRGGEFVKDHPILVVGGALTFGLLLGAFLGRTSRD